MMEPVDPFIQNQLGSLPRHEPRSGFREEARRAFLAGAGDEPADPSAPSTDSKSSRRTPLAVIPLFAAAALLALVVWGARPAGVWIASPDTDLFVDGVSFTGGTLPAGARVENRAGGPRRIEIPGVLVCELAPGTVVTLEGRRRLGGEPLRASVEDGMLLGATGEAFPGRGLEVATREGVTTVTGTTFGVLAGADSTCVCVLEGVVRLEALHLPARRVEPGASWIVYRDGDERGEPLREDQIDMLRAVRDAARTP
jgi:hypothetical protein